MKSAALKYTKDVLIQHLRWFLTNLDNYRHITSRDYTGAVIFDKDPQELRQYPAIVITGSNGQIMNTGLSDMAYELYDGNGDFVGYRYGGMYEFNITVDIGTRSTADRENLTDLVTMALRVHLRKYMESKGVLVKDMRFGGESEVQYGQDKIYVSQIQFGTWSEWYKDVELLPMGDVTITQTTSSPDEVDDN